jgi:ketosteroid isomerase-like protein
MSTTQSVFEHHLQCFGTADLDGILSDYSENAVLLTRVGAFNGRAAIRSFFEAAFADFAKPGTTFDAGQSYLGLVGDAERTSNSAYYELGIDRLYQQSGKVNRAKRRLFVVHRPSRHGNGSAAISRVLGERAHYVE